jgi:hypothetical protein
LTLYAGHAKIAEEIKGKRVKELSRNEHLTESHVMSTKSALHLGPGDTYTTSLLLGWKIPLKGIL